MTQLKSSVQQAIANLYHQHQRQPSDDDIARVANPFMRLQGSTPPWLDPLTWHVMGQMIRGGWDQPATRELAVHVGRIKAQGSKVNADTAHLALLGAYLERAAGLSPDQAQTFKLYLREREGELAIPRLFFMAIHARHLNHPFRQLLDQIMRGRSGDFSDRALNYYIKHFAGDGRAQPQRILRIHNVGDSHVLTWDEHRKAAILFSDTGKGDDENFGVLRWAEEEAGGESALLSGRSRLLFDGPDAHDNIVPQPFFGADDELTREIITELDLNAQLTQTEHLTSANSDPTDTMLEGAFRTSGGMPDFMTTVAMIGKL